MQILELQEIINLSIGTLVTYVGSSRDRIYRGRPTQGSIESVKRTHSGNFNILISIKGANIIVSTEDYKKNWYLTK